MELVPSPDDPSTLLIDSALYDYNEDWSKVFAKMPELSIRPLWELQFGLKPNTSLADVLTEHAEDLRRAQDKGSRDEQRRDDPSAQEIRENYEEHEWYQELLKLNFDKYHRHAVSRPMFIEDIEAHDTGLVLLVWLDFYGRVVRYMRVGREDAEAVLATFQDGTFDNR